jgi:hypothetical protein
MELSKGSGLEIISSNLRTRCSDIRQVKYSKGETPSSLIGSEFKMDKAEFREYLKLSLKFSASKAWG